MHFCGKSAGLGPDRHTVNASNATPPMQYFWQRAGHAIGGFADAVPVAGWVPGDVPPLDATGPVGALGVPVPLLPELVASGQWHLPLPSRARWQGALQTAAPPEDDPVPGPRDVEPLPPCWPPPLPIVPG